LVVGEIEMFKDKRIAGSARGKYFHQKIVYGEFIGGSWSEYYTVEEEREVGDGRREDGGSNRKGSYVSDCGLCYRVVAWGR
jgi:hypothetical protein